MADQGGAVRRGRKPGVSREQLVEAIGRVVAERGYEATRFSDVATVAGTSVGSLQWTFRSREDMVVEGLEAITRRYFTDVETRATTIENPVDRLRWIATYLVVGLGDDESAQQEWVVWTEYWRASLREPKLRESSVVAYENWLRLVGDAVLACVEAGAIRPRMEVEEIAVAVVAMGDGLGIQAALRAGRMTWDRSGALLRSWLADALDCPELA
ncbi:TetR family transcriptional regulator C-terminal domain-containing protein [Streptomyces sp. NPDC047070]|uniref:TetR/AcrR family transcriptional regulator n=1 Tax=Streptomyces sp. NPDC047070 TaxID=3154923 RepID=UPI0034556551